MSKTDYSLVVQRHNDLLKAYSKICGTCWTQAEAYQRTVKLPAPRYYVSRKQAYQVISKMLRGDYSEVNTFKANRRRMYFDLLKKTIDMSERRGYLGKSLWYIMQFVVIEPAPEFYLTPKAFQKIFVGMKNGTIRADGMRYLRKPKTKKR